MNGNIKILLKLLIALAILMSVNLIFLNNVNAETTYNSEIALVHAT